VLRFILRQLISKNFWLLFLATVTMTLMFAWRGKLRNAIFWDVLPR